MHFFPDIDDVLSTVCDEIFGEHIVVNSRLFLNLLCHLIRHGRLELGIS